MRSLYGQNTLPVIMSSTRIAYLVIIDANIKDHSGRDIAMATSRHVAWIVNARKLAKQICKSCLRCRSLRKMLEDQQRSSLPASLQVAAPPFTIGLDLIGPITINAMVNKRAKMKVWIVIFICFNVKAVCMEVAPVYSIQDFLLAYHSHISQRGDPSFVHSDRGSQLVAASRSYLKILRSMIGMLSQLQQLNREPPESLPQQVLNGGMVSLKHLSRSLSYLSVSRGSCSH